MDARRFRQLEQLFRRAAAAGPADRGRILAEARQLDEELGHELERLLVAQPASAVLDQMVANAGAAVLGEHGVDERPPEAAAPRPASASARSPAEPSGAARAPSLSPSAELIERLSGRSAAQWRYRIEGEIGRGGMGEVLRAFDPDLRRDLAMKVALDTSAADDARDRERLARFLEEAQVTGQLDHPGIVPVHELGLDAHGRLYFTMRLVSGQELGVIYDLARRGAEGWSTARVLGVLLKVCEAVAYAHSKGVIHRDLKPSNVMVGRFGEVYVMDWGLAKVMERTDSGTVGVRATAAGWVGALHSTRSDERAAVPDTPLVTTDGTVVGTPAYMPPEQARGDVAAMDARSDVYALGAMLYHLLAGHAPYREDGLAPERHVLWRRIADEPPVPLAQRAPAAPRELVAIAERAMARAMAARYPSMAALADDLRAYLEGRVVGAYETGAFAELRKWVGRNKALAGALAAAALAVAGGAVASALAADRATKAAVVATIARKEAEASAASARQREAEARASERRALTVTELVQNALVSADPNQAGTQKYLVTQAMDQAIAEIERGAMRDDPKTEASLQLTIARILVGNSRAEDGLRLAQQALATRRRLFPGDHLAVAEGHHAVAYSLQSLGRLPQALAENEIALAMRQRLCPADCLAVAESLSNIGGCLRAMGRRDQALGRLEAALAMYQRLFAGDHALVATGLNNVATCQQLLGHGEQALPKLQAALAMRRRLFPGDHPSVAVSLNNVAACLYGLGKRGDALPMYEEALAMRQRLFQGDHPAVATNLDNLGGCLRSLGQHDEALAKHEAALAMNERLFPDGHTGVATSLGNVAGCLHVMGRHEEALPRFEAALAMWQRMFGDDHPEVAVALINVADCLHAQGRSAEALDHAERACTVAARKLPEKHPRREYMTRQLQKIRAAQRAR